MLSRYAGCAGMVTGQAIDLAATGQPLQLEQLKTMHGYKTGALIEASVLMGAIATGAASQQQLDALRQFASAIGLAFQIQDDILDVESSTEQLGKQQGSDVANDKSTYTSILGLEQAREQAAELHQQSMSQSRPVCRTGRASATTRQLYCQSGLLTGLFGVRFTFVNRYHNHGKNIYGYTTQPTRYASVRPYRRACGPASTD